MAELHEEAVWHVPYTAEQIQESIGKNPIPSEPDENNTCYWLVWDIEKMEYVSTGIEAFIGDIDAVGQYASAAEQAAANAAESSSSAKQSAEKAQAIKDSLPASGGGVGSPYSSDFYLYITGQHPFLNAGPYSDLQSINMIYQQREQLIQMWKVGYAAVRKMMARNISISSSTTSITVYDGSVN